MNKSEGKATGTGIFKHQDSRYMKYLKEQLDRRETMDKLISVRTDINQVDRMGNEMQRDNLNHNTLEHLQHQINQFKKLTFTL